MFSVDLARFAEAGWEVKRALAVDMFPKTRHVETCLLLVRETYPRSIEATVDVAGGDVTEHPTYKQI